MMDNEDTGPDLLVLDCKNPGRTYVSAAVDCIDYGPQLKPLPFTLQRRRYLSPSQSRDTLPFGVS